MNLMNYNYVKMLQEERWREMEGYRLVAQTMGGRPNTLDRILLVISNLIIQFGTGLKNKTDQQSVRPVYNHELFNLTR